MHQQIPEDFQAVKEIGVWSLLNAGREGIRLQLDPETVKAKDIFDELNPDYPPLFIGSTIS